ncbi:MAG: hypothetical protein UIH99_04960, partial [Alphaproteobacteria bacterium]|nr:hypothetical protein [Alphaproteobacteria bacterium]
FLSVVLQVSYRTQDRQLNRVRRDIVQIQQKVAMAEASFASYVRPEILRNMVVTIAPKSEVVSFQKSVEIDKLPVRDNI